LASSWIRNWAGSRPSDTLFSDLAVAQKSTGSNQHTVIIANQPLPEPLTRPSLTGTQHTILLPAPLHIPLAHPTPMAISSPLVGNSRSQFRIQYRSLNSPIETPSKRNAPSHNIVPHSPLNLSNVPVLPILTLNTSSYLAPMPSPPDLVVLPWLSPLNLNPHPTLNPVYMVSLPSPLILNLDPIPTPKNSPVHIAKMFIYNNPYKDSPLSIHDNTEVLIIFDSNIKHFTQGPLGWQVDFCQGLNLKMLGEVLANDVVAPKNLKHLMIFCGINDRCQSNHALLLRGCIKAALALGEVVHFHAIVFSGRE